MRAMVASIIALAVAAPLAAQTPQIPARSDERRSISLRPFLIASGQSFSAKETFRAAFGQSFEPFWGGGLQLAFRNGIYVDVTGSRFKKSGQRTFRFDGQTFGLGIPLTVTETPFEVTGGYRLRTNTAPRATPYGGAGFGSYGYTETSDFADAGDNVDTRHLGALLVGGVEFRLSRWIHVSGDVQYTHVPGILGAGGISQNAAPGDKPENDLGGVAARIRFIIGR